MEEIALLHFFADKVSNVQEYLNENAKFLTLFGGRGLFYIGAGLMMVLRCSSLPFCLSGLAGCANIITGVLCVMLYFGYTPNFTRQMQEAGDVVSSLTGQNQEFEDAQKQYLKKRDHVASKAQKEMDALLKHATVGELDPQKEPRPGGMFNMSAKAAWEARRKLIGKTKGEAQQLFVIRARVENLK